MNKLIIAVLLIGLIGCKKEEVKQNTTTEVDCQCDRVVKVIKYKQGEGVYCLIWTVNDCTNWSKHTDKSFSSEALSPDMGDCYKMPY